MLNTSSCRNTFSHLARASMLHFYIIHFVYFASYFSCYVIISPFGASRFVDIFLLSIFFLFRFFLLFLSLSLFLSICLASYLSVCLSIYPVYISIYLSINLFVCISIYLSLLPLRRLTPYPPPLLLSLCLSIYLSPSISFFLSLSPSVSPPIPYPNIPPFPSLSLPYHSSCAQDQCSVSSVEVIFHIHGL